MMEEEYNKLNTKLISIDNEITTLKLSMSKFLKEIDNIKNKINDMNNEISKGLNEIKNMVRDSHG